MITISQLPGQDLATVRFGQREKFRKICKTHPFMRDPAIQDVIFNLLEHKPKTGDELIVLLEEIRGKSALLLRVLEDEELMDIFQIRRTVVGKIQLLFAKVLKKEVIDRNVPATFLCNETNQKIRAEVYSLWKGLEIYIEII